jgi:ornithine decarboxylase
MGVTALRENRYISPAMQLTPEEHEQLIATTNQRLQRLEASDAFQTAVRPRDARVTTEIFVAYPDRKDPTSELVRAAADALNEFVFAQKDGDDPEQVRRALAPYRARDMRVIAVRHKPASPSAIIAALRLLGPVSGRPAYSLSVIEKEWGVDVSHVAAATRFPDGSALPADLLDSPQVFDIPFTAVVSDDPCEGADVNNGALMALYNALLRLVREGGGRYIVGLMDVESIYEPLRKRAPEAWTEFQGLQRKRVLSRVPGSNVSTAAIVDVKTWEETIAKKRPALHGLLFGDLLSKRSVAFTGFKGADVPLFDAMPHNDRLAPVRLERLEHETPFLCMDLDTIARRYATFRRELPGVEVHYAMKCNPDRRLLAHLRSLGCKFEIASRSELDALLAIEVDAGSILFSNPVRHAQQTRYAADAGVYRFAFDSEDELASLAQNAPGASVYVRLATDAAESKVRSEGKFGVALASAMSLMLRAREHGLCPYGIAFHVGSQAEQPELWRAAIAKSAELMRQLQAEGIRIEMLNLGGGYPAFHRVGVPSISEIAKVIRAALATELPYAPERLVIEPGRGLVSDAGVMVSTVIGVARRRDKTWVHLDLGGFTMLEALESGHTLDYPVADSLRSKKRMTSHITAATCDSMDTIVYDNRALSADLKRGDRVFIYAAGAYTSSYASTFNGFDKPRIYYVSE